MGPSSELLPIKLIALSKEGNKASEWQGDPISTEVYLCNEQRVQKENSGVTSSNIHTDCSSLANRLMSLFGTGVGFLLSFN